jgi:hypothetical protein
MRLTAHTVHHGMRLPITAHTSRPWRIHELAPDFRLEDVWELPTPGGRDDLARLVRACQAERLAPWPGRRVLEPRRGGSASINQQSSHPGDGPGPSPRPGSGGRA